MGFFCCDQFWFFQYNPWSHRGQMTNFIHLPLLVSVPLAFENFAIYNFFKNLKWITIHKLIRSLSWKDDFFFGTFLYSHATRNSQLHYWQVDKSSDTIWTLSLNILFFLSSISRCQVWKKEFQTPFAKKSGNQKEFLLHLHFFKR